MWGVCPIIVRSEKMKVYVSDKDDKKKYIKTVEKGKNDSLKMT